MNQIKLMTILCFITGLSFAQESIGGRPYSLDNNVRVNVPVIATTNKTFSQFLDGFTDFLVAGLISKLGVIFSISVF